MIVSASLFFIVVSFFLFALLNRYKKTKQQQKVIQAQKLIVEEKVSELGAKQKEILDSINYASTLQSAMLPNIKEFENKQIKFELIFKPKDIVSGDFYWLTRKDNFLFVVVADCTGHGVPGAFMSLMGISFLNEIVNESEVVETNLILNALRNKVATALNSKQNAEFRRDGMDLVLMRIDVNSLELQFSGANNFIYINNKNEMIELKGDKMPIGIQEGASEFFKQQNYQLQKGSKIIITTDGLPDQFGGLKNKKFMYKQLEKIILENQSRPISPLKDLIDREYQAWKANNEQVDDITCMFIEIEQ